MSGHASVELLSIYVDAGLAGTQRLQVEEHLRTCPECRHRLAGLRRVAHRLERLPLAAPPSDLAGRIRRGARSQQERHGWWESPGAGLRQLLAGPPLIHLFALVVALAAFVYLFAYGVAGYRDRPTRIVLPGPGAPPVASAPAAEPRSGAATARLRLLGGVFHRVGGVWVEQGLASRSPDDSLRLWRSSSLAHDPELAALAALDAPVRLRVGEQVVEIAFEPGGPAEGP